MNMTQNGEMVVNVREIGLRYLKTWFIIDFLSTVPLDFLVSINGAFLGSLEKYNQPQCGL